MLQCRIAPDAAKLLSKNKPAHDGIAGRAIDFAIRNAWAK